MPLRKPNCDSHCIHGAQNGERREKLNNRLVSVCPHLAQVGEGDMMAPTILDTISGLWWPLGLGACAWLIVTIAAAEKDEISEIVDVLTKKDDLGIPETKGEVMTGAKVCAANRRDDHEANARITSAPMQAAMPMVKVRHPRAAAAAALAAVVAVSTLPAEARRYDFDQRRSEVSFVYKMVYATQRGRFTKVSGTLEYDEAAPEKSRINAEIAAGSLSTGEAIVDDELKGAGFFNAEASPVIAFKSLGVRALSASEADVSGEITINRITKPVTLKVVLKPHDDPALKHDAGARKFVATTRIKRSAFNMTKYQSLVDDDVELEIAAIVRPR